MKNALKYYYNIEATEIHRKKEKYSFDDKKNKYLLCPYHGTYEELQEIYKLYIYIESIGMYCHKIILNNKHEIFTIINDISYVLINIKINNRIIDIKDIISLSNILINQTEYNSIKRNNWSKMWSEKIDFMEYEISQSGNKYPIINKSIDYNIGIVENCIQVINNEKKNDNLLNAISHRRLNINTTTEEFYNPLNFIIDNRVRDICEYIKSIMENKTNVIPYIDQYIYNSKLSKEEIEKLFIRIMYPSNYLDKVESIIENKNSETILETYFKNIEQYENSIRTIYNHLNTFSPLPDIEWIKKKMSNNINNTSYLWDLIH